MKKIQDTIDEAARLIAEIGFDQRQKDLNTEKQRISREKYKVAGWPFTRPENPHSSIKRS